MTSPVISAAELHDLLAKESANLVVVDSRHDLANPAWGRDAYLQAHIPGAIFVSIDDDLSAELTGSNGRHPLPTPEQFAQTLEKLGIGNHHRVVVYDQGSTMFAGRLWWMLRWLGHDAVQVLDGGFAQWEKQGYATEAGAGRAPVQASFTARVQPQLLRTVAQTQATLGDDLHLIVDARAPERYRGDVEPMDRVAGHIPGALNRPFALNQRDGVFKPADELRAEFAALLAGKTADKVIHQCGSGVSGCANVLAMEYAGLQGSALYAGSWSEWSSDPTRPVATGEA